MAPKQKKRETSLKREKLKKEGFIIDSLTRNKDLPASVGLVLEVRDELKADFRSLDAKITGIKTELEGKISDVKAEVQQVKIDVQQLKSDVQQLKIDVQQLKSDVQQLKTDVQQLKADVQQVKSEVQQVLSAVHRVQALAEEQRSENRIVLDAYKTLMEEHKRFNDRLFRVEKHSGLTV